MSTPRAAVRQALIISNCFVLLRMNKTLLDPDSKCPTTDQKNEQDETSFRQTSYVFSQLYE